ncbi:MAG: hypothetical protein K1X74_17510 [Pirellulales bacterium]|nr:hypothetical protein [Pirellulales bacterium]
MRDVLSWSLSLGRWAGLGLRIHVSFLLFAVLALYLSSRDPQRDLVLYALSALGVLLLSVLLHELAHAVAARRLGGRADQIILWPLGGLSWITVPVLPQLELLMWLAGPVANLTICVVLLPGVFFAQLSPATVLNPLSPPVPVGSLTGPDILALVFWINWTLLIANCLPAAPLDGGRVLRELLRPKLGYRSAVLVVTRVAQVTAVSMGVLGVLLHERYQFAWLPLVLCGIFLFFSAKQEFERYRERDSDDNAFGYDFSQGYTSLERSFEPPARAKGPGPIRAWLERRRDEQQRRRRELEALEDRRVDDILARLSETGMDALSPDDRALLNRASKRYRNRAGR